LSENFEGIITDVQFRHDKECFYDENTNKLYITVFHNQNEIAQAECHADDGNGYYYSVLSVRVTNIDGKKIDDFTLLEA
jgi:bacteriophage protein